MVRDSGGAAGSWRWLKGGRFEALEGYVWDLSEVLGRWMCAAGGGAQVGRSLR